MLFTKRLLDQRQEETAGDIVSLLGEQHVLAVRQTRIFKQLCPSRSPLYNGTILFLLGLHLYRVDIRAKPRH